MGCWLYRLGYSNLPDVNETLAINQDRVVFAQVGLDADSVTWLYIYNNKLY